MLFPENTGPRLAIEETSLSNDELYTFVTNRVIDRFHIHKLACDAVQELRIKHRWNAIQQANKEMEEAKKKNKDYRPYRYSNGNTRKEIHCAEQSVSLQEL